MLVMCTDSYRYIESNCLYRYVSIRIEIKSNRNTLESPTRFHVLSPLAARARLTNALESNSHALVSRLICESIQYYSSLQISPVPILTLHYFSHSFQAILADPDSHQKVQKIILQFNRNSNSTRPPITTTPSTRGRETTSSFNYTRTSFR